MLDQMRHEKLRQWIKEMIVLCQPRKVTVCSGHPNALRILYDEMVTAGTLIRLNEKLRPNSFLARSHPKDVARVEERTFVCSARPEEAGPTNNWKDPQEMLAHLHTLFKGCMQRRTLYVIPFSMGPVGATYSRVGVQITDSPYVVVSMACMTRIGEDVLNFLEEDGPFVPCMHSMGMPLAIGQKDVAWPCAPEKVVAAHFPETRSVWSFGSGYGGNALLGKKSFALRLASVMAKEEGWLAEHMLVVGITNPEGVKRYIAAAFPSACGKTNLAMMQAALPGWKVECVGDDIAWIHKGADGRFYAINPEAGFFGVAPGTSALSNPHALACCAKNTLFTNVALTPQGDVWWEGMTPTPPEGLIDWQGNPWKPGETPAAHPNSRFTAPASQCPVLDPQWQEPRGVPLSALIFGGRRATTVPLVTEALNWEHGVGMGAAISSEATAAAVGEIGKVRHDPFAMLPFCGYNMGDYFQHWLEMGKTTNPSTLPQIYRVNWFRKGADGTYLWPGFGDNIRVIKWIFERLDKKVEAVQTPIGNLPHPEDIERSGLSLSLAQMTELCAYDPAAWGTEQEEMEHYLQRFGTHLPLLLRREFLQKSKV